MKILIQFFLLTFSLDVCSQTQQKDTFQITCDQPQLQRQIISSDTTAASHSNKIVILNVDKNKQIISTVTITDTKNTFAFDFKNLGKARYSTTYYDTAHHVIYETISENGVTFHCYRYTYNDKGQLVYKEGYSSGEIGVKIQYEYDTNGKLLKEIIDRPGGTTKKN